MVDTTNFDAAEWEDAIVEKLVELQGITLENCRPSVNVDEDADFIIHHSPGYLVLYTGMQPFDEPSPIGRPLCRKMRVAFAVNAIAPDFRVDDEHRATASIHSLLLNARKQLMGWKPSLVAAQRPLEIQSEGELVYLEEERLVVWAQEWSTMVLVREIE